MVIVNNLMVSIKKRLLIKGISCSLECGKITIFIGKSGAGKTTLLKSLVGLLDNTQGQILVDDKELAAASHKERAKIIGYVFQNFNLFPNLTVLQNCTDPLLVYGYSLQDATQQATKLLYQLGLQDLLHKYPAELSGGQQQRVAIARALGLRPAILLLDEPTASLDPINTAVLVDLLKSLADSGLTIGVSSQDMAFVRKIFDRVYFIEDGVVKEFCDDITRLTDYPAINDFLTD